MCIYISRTLGVLEKKTELYIYTQINFKSELQLLEAVVLNDTFSFTFKN